MLHFMEKINKSDNRSVPGLNYLWGEDKLIDFLPEVLWVFGLQRTNVHISSCRGT